LILKIKKSLNFAEGKGLLDIDTNIETGRLVAITGPSGSGKTTLLRIIAGLTEVDEGKITINKQTWLDTQNDINLPTQRRKIGYVFQSYALFPNMTVQENLTFALEKNQSQSIVTELINTMELGTLANKYPNQLSGGQQQRVALARSLVRQPAILLLDEPLSALDRELRLKLQTYLIKIHQKYQITTILVSHDIEEIRNMADRVVVLKNGKVIDDNTPKAVFTTQNEDHLQILEGTIIEVGLSEKENLVKVKIGNNLLEIPVKNPNEFSKGQVVKVIFSSTIPQVSISPNLR